MVGLLFCRDTVGVFYSPSQMGYSVLRFPVCIQRFERFAYFCSYIICAVVVALFSLGKSFQRHRRDEEMTMYSLERKKLDMWSKKKYHSVFFYCVSVLVPTGFKSGSLKGYVFSPYWNYSNVAHSRCWGGGAVSQAPNLPSGSY